ncbi:MAG: nickel-dependent lactate racemase [Candidatus Methanomethylicia archaeon]
MIIEIPYGNKRIIKCKVPSEISIETLNLKKAITGDVNVSIDREIEDFIYDKGKILLVVNDQERPTPTSKILNKIHEKIKDKEVKIIVATGAHRSPTEEELKWILGNKYECYRYRTVIHDAKKVEEHEYIGETKRGNRVYIDKRLLEADKIIVIGSVEPHYFAGYTGGRKFLLPGLSSYETIEYNHRFALDSNATLLKLNGNPVHEDMMDALEVLGRIEDIYSIMMVLDANGELASIKTGNIKTSFMESVEKANEIFIVESHGKGDIVVAVANNPFDISLYQAQKAIEHSKLVVKDGGIIILVAECRDGIGPRNFYDLLLKSRENKDVESTLEHIKRNYKLGYHKAAKMLETFMRTDVWAVTSLRKEVLEDIGIRAFYDLEEAINEAIRIKGKDAEVKVVYNASTIVPLPKSNTNLI